MSKDIRLGKTERFILKYLYENELKEIRIATKKLILDSYNEECGTNVKDIRESLLKLLKKEFVVREWVNNKYYYLITNEGIVIIKEEIKKVYENLTPH